MRIFRKRKKFGNFRGTPEDAAPLPDIVYQMGAEVAAQYAVAQSMSQNPYASINSAGQEAIYDYPRVPVPIGEENFIDDIPEDEFGERTRASSPLNFLASAFGIGRSKSRERRAHRSGDRFVRAGSPMYFNQRPPGTPVKFRRRPASPELIQARVASPYHFAQQERVPSPLHFAQQERVSSPLNFAQQSRPGSPDVARRLHRAYLSQELQHIERQQRRQQDMMMINSNQFMPQYQQVQQPYYPMMNSNMNIQAYPMIQQPQMYSYY